MSTKISWCHKPGYAGETWNFITGCSKVSAGCQHCFAERMSLQFGWSKKPWSNQNAAENIIFHEDRLRKPYSWKNPTFCFVNSLSDVFHPLVKDEWLRLSFDVMRDLPQHIFAILTKRPERMATCEDWPSNVWAGTSVESQRVIDRLDVLRHCKASVRFVSFEPLITPIEKVNLRGIQWAIVGGESGPDFREMKHAWARDLRDQCVAAGVAFFFKQSASKRPESMPYLIEADGTKTEWHQYPGDPQVIPPREESPRPTISQLSLW